MIDNVPDALGLGIEGRNRRVDYSSAFRHREHVTDVTPVQRRLANHHHQAPTFLERHIRGPRQQCRRNAARNFREGPNRTGRDQHAKRSVRAAGNTRPDIRHWMDDIGQRVAIAAAERRLIFPRHLASTRHNEMSLDVKFAKDLKRAYAVDDAGRARDANDYTLPPAFIHELVHGYT